MSQLERLAATRGLPRGPFLNNGPEFTRRALDIWAHQRGLRLDFIQPGMPVQNAFVESFNARFRDERLQQNWFTSLTEAQTIIEHWGRD